MVFLEGSWAVRLGSLFLFQPDGFALRANFHAIVAIAFLKKTVKNLQIPAFGYYLCT